MKKITVLLVYMLFQHYSFAGNATYVNTETGISFSYTDSMKLDTKPMKEKPLNLVFTYGTPPFSTSILFKEIEGSSTMQDFIKKEYASQREGKYQDEVLEKKYMINKTTEAVEFIRKTPFGTIYYFIFPSNHILYSFYHVTSKNADPDQNTLKVYNMMKKSLKVDK